MVGAIINFTIDTSQFAGGMKALDQLNQPDTLHPAWDAIGAALVSGTRRRMREGVSPQGEHWPPSQRVLRHGGKTLIDTGRLWNSLVWHTLPNGVEYGTDVIYAAVHQFGWPARRIPARPYLGMTDEDAKSAEVILRDTILAKVAEAAKLYQRGEMG